MRLPSPDIPARSGLVVGVMVVTIATYMTYALSLLNSAFIARGLRPYDFGRYSYGVWLCGWLVLLINNGLTTSGIRFVAELLGAGSVDGARRTHGYLLRLSHYCEAFVLVGFVVLALIIRPSEWRGAMTVFITVIVVGAYAKSRYLFDISIAKGYGQFAVEAYSTVTAGFVTAVMVIALFLLQARFGFYLLAFGFSSLIFMWMAGTQLRRRGMVPADAAPSDDVLARLRPHLQWTTLLTGVAILGNKNIEVFVLNLVRGPAEVGFFTIGAAFTRGGIDLLTSGLMAVLMPTMSNAFGRGGEGHVHRVFTDSVRYFAFAGLLAAGVGVALSRPTVQLLYGPNYERSILAMQVMVAVSGLTLAEAAFGALLSTTDRQRSRALLVTTQIVIAVGCAALLIPRYGFVGALASHAVSRFIGFTLMFGWVSRVYPSKPPLRQLLGVLLSGLLAAGGAWWGARLVGGLAGCFVAAAVYMALLVAFTLVLRCWARSDFRFASRLLERYVPNAPGVRQWVLGLGERFGV